MRAAGGSVSLLVRTGGNTQVRRRHGVAFLRVCRSVRLAVAGVCLLVAGLGADVTVFGPQPYAGTGRPVLSRRAFTVPEGGEGYTLRVVNRGVIGALVVLND